MPDFKKISETLQGKNIQERYVIVEKGEPRWVVLSMQDYEALTQKKDASRNQKDQAIKERIEEELVSYQADIEQEEREAAPWEMLSEEEAEEPELYFEEVEEQEEITPESRDLSTSSEAKRKMEWNDIPF